MTCHLGDFEEYAALRRDAEGPRGRAGPQRGRPSAGRRPPRSLEALKIGDVIRVPAGRNAGLAVVLDPGLVRVDAEPAADRAHGRAAGPPAVRDGLPVTGRGAGAAADPEVVQPAQPAEPARPRRDAARHGARRRRPRQPPAARRRGGRRRDHPAADGDPAAPLPRLRRPREPRPLGRALPPAAPRDRAAPAPGRSRGPTRIARRVRPGLRGARRRSATSTATTVTDDGRRLARIYSELDLLAAECLRDGLWDGLAPAELAACVSTLVYESRHADDDDAAAAAQTAACARSWPTMVRDWGRLDAAGEGPPPVVPARAGPRLRLGGLALGLGGSARDGARPRCDLGGGGLRPLDPQLLDLLDQVAQASDGKLRTSADAASRAMRRGVISYSSVT